MLCNGYGEHNIQGIGDKHIPLIHNVMNTDVVVGVSDRTTDALNQLFNSNVGREYLTDRRQKSTPTSCGSSMMSACPASPTSSPPSSSPGISTTGRTTWS